MRRIDVRLLLSKPIARRLLMVQAIMATQAREGIVTTEEQAKQAYDKVQKERTDETSE